MTGDSHLYIGATPAGVIGAAEVSIGVNASAPSVGLTSTIQFYLDEVGNNLKVKVKYGNGTDKTATIPLTSP